MLTLVETLMAVVFIAPAPTRQCDVVLLTRQQMAPTESVCQEVRRRSFRSHRGWRLVVAMETGRGTLVLPERNTAGQSLQQTSCHVTLVWLTW